MTMENYLRDRQYRFAIDLQSRWVYQCHKSMFSQLSFVIGHVNFTIVNDLMPTFIGTNLLSTYLHHAHVNHTLSLIPNVRIIPFTEPELSTASIDVQNQYLSTQMLIVICALLVTISLLCACFRCCTSEVIEVDTCQRNYTPNPEYCSVSESVI